MKLFLCFLSKSEILFFLGQRNNLRDFFFGPPCFSAKIELHFTLNYAAHVNQDVNRKSMDQRNNLRDFIFKHII